MAAKAAKAEEAQKARKATRRELPGFKVRGQLIHSKVPGLTWKSHKRHFQVNTTTAAAFTRPHEDRQGHRRAAV